MITSRECIKLFFGNGVREALYLNCHNNFDNLVIAHLEKHKNIDLLYKEGIFLKFASE